MEKVVRMTARWNRVFREVNNSRHRYRVLKGSAGSGKSVDIAQNLILRLSDTRYKGANLLVVRKIGESNRDSTFAELRAAIHRLFGEYADRIWKVAMSPLSLECKLTGNRIIFRGMKDISQREKVKSITFRHGDLCWVWIEEATELQAEDLDILDDRLRGELPAGLFYQITMTFNPVSAAHWIKGRFFDRVDEDVLTNHSTYRDNRFIDSAYYRRMERRKELDPEGYEVYGLGRWGELGGLILSRYSVEAFNPSPLEFDAFSYGQDFGFNHNNVILGVGSRDGNLYICSELVCSEMDTAEIIGRAERAGIDKRIEMHCDSAEPDRIRTWAKAGYRARAVKKEAGSVAAQIDFLKGRQIFIHPSCQHTIKEMSQWRWKKDKTTGYFIDEPLEVEDDAMAALRYSVERLRRGATFKGFTGR